MKYITVKDAAEKWGVSQVLVRRYCAQGRVPRAKYQNGIWCIPEKASKPDRTSSAITVEVELPPLGKKLVQQKKKKNYHGLYDYTQINLTYASSRMASNRLTRDQVESIFRKGKVRESFEPMKVSDCIEVLNHTYCIDFILDHIGDPLSNKFIQQLHYHLMFGTVDQRKKVVTPGVYRKENVSKGDRTISPPARILSDIEGLTNNYESLYEIGLVEILDFHVKFEKIAPFGDGNGRIGRLIMFKECLRHNIMPFILDDKRRSKYIAGIQAWDRDCLVLMQVVAEAQERFEKQVKRHQLAEYRAPEFQNLEDMDEETEDE